MEVIIMYLKVKENVPLIPKEDLKAMELAAKAGDVEMQMRLADVYLSGEGAKPDLSKCIYYLKKAAGHGNSYAIYCLSDFAFDKETRIKLITEAMEKGCIEAKYDLALRYSEGDEVEKNYKYAFELFHELANSGNIDPMLEVAQCYENGCGIDRDIFLAIEWYKKAATQGCERAIMNLERIGASV